jgi:8-oxo-dGTP diphosphatase
VNPPVVTVVAAVIEDGDRVLVTRRPAGAHLEGLWEFPGGKVVPGETHAESLAREILEELDAGCTVGEELLATEHAYPDRIVRLHFFRCRLTGEPRSMLGQDLRWVSRADLATLAFPPADDELVGRLMRGDPPASASKR